MKLRTTLLALALLSVQSVQADEQEDYQVKTQVLSKGMSEDCPYMGEVTIEVKFRLLAEDISMGELVLQGSNDGISFFRVDSKPFEGTRGHTKFTFDAGECLQALNVKLEQLN